MRLSGIAFGQVSRSHLAIMLSAACCSGLLAASPVDDASKSVNDVHFSRTTLRDAIDFLSDASGANIDVDWKALEAVGISKDTPVSLRLKNVPLRVALAKTLESAAPGRADFYVAENVITVTSHEAADSKMVTRTVPVDDLLLDIPDFTGPSLDLASSTSGSGGRNGRSSGSGSSSTSSGSGSGGGSGQSIFSQDDRSTEKKISRAEKAAQLIETIESTVRPDIWDVNGGKARIRFFNGSLIITAPESVQRLIS